MAEYRVDPMKPDDYVEAVAGLALAVDPWENGQTYCRLGPAYAARVDGRLAAVAGVVFPWPRRGCPWAIWTDVGRQHPVFVHRAVVRQLRLIVRQTRPRRLDAEVMAGFRAGQRWATALGLRPEWIDAATGQPGLLRAYGPSGEDMIRYVWVAQEAAHGR